MSQPGDVYIGGFDYARGGSDLTNAKGDDFSMSTGRLRGDKIQYVHQIRHTGIQTSQASAMIHDLHARFKYKMIVADGGGGGLFVRDDLRKPMQGDGRRNFPVRPIITKDDVQLAGVGDDCLVLFRRGDPVVENQPPVGLGLTFPSDAGIINKAHEEMKTAIEKQIVEVPPTWKGWGQAGPSFSSPDAMRKWLNKQHGLTELDRVRAEMDLTMLQLITVDRKTDKEGKPMLDSKGFFTFMSKRKKDSAYAFVYMHFGCWIYNQLLSHQAKSQEDRRDFICESEAVNPLESLNGRIPSP